MTPRAALVAGTLRLRGAELPDGKGWASETVTAITHAGTHVDAPATTSRPAAASAARTIDELPLDWFLRPGVRLDLRGLERGAEITVADLEARARPGTSCARGDRAAVDGRGGRVGPPDYPQRRAPAWAATARCGCSTAA